MTDSWAVRVYGTPKPKGSMKCIGGRGRHQLVNTSPDTETWQHAVAGAAARLAEVSGLVDGPVELDLTLTVDRPKSVSREWPHVRSAGDTDKHLRAVCDGLEQGGLLADDAQVCVITAAKVYPHSPHPNALHRPGAFIRITRL